MKNYLNLTWWYPFLLLGGLYYLFSCTDNIGEGHGDSVNHTRKRKNKNEELTIATAKEWYQNHYAPVVTTRSSIMSSIDRMMKPYWEKAKESNRKRYEVVEIPIKTKGGHLILDAETSNHWSPGTSSGFIRNTAKIVIEKDKQTGRTRSFVMIFVGSYNYLQKTHTMGKNSYLYRQPDFEGSVLFYEVNGVFINGWHYEKGKIVAMISPKVDRMFAGSTQSRALVEDCTEYCYTSYDQVCDEDTWAEEDDEYGFSFGTTVSCHDESETICTEVCNYYDDGQDYNEWEDDNWEEDSPAGGSNTPYEDEEPIKDFPSYHDFSEIFKKVAILKSPDVYKS